MPLAPRLSGILSGNSFTGRSVLFRGGLRLRPSAPPGGALPGAGFRRLLPSPAPFPRLPPTWWVRLPPSAAILGRARAPAAGSAGGDRGEPGRGAVEGGEGRDGWGRGNWGGGRWARARRSLTGGAPARPA